MTTFSPRLPAWSITQGLSESSNAQLEPVKTTSVVTKVVSILGPISCQEGKASLTSLAADSVRANKGGT